MHVELRALEPPHSEEGRVSPTALVAAQLWEALAAIHKPPDVSALMNAATEYELAGYQANALCLARAIRRALSSMPDADPLLEGAVTFLERRFVQLRGEPHQPAAVSDDADFPELSRTIATNAVLRGLDHGARYFLTGEEAEIAQAIGFLDRAFSGYTAVGDAMGSSLTGNILAMLRVMYTRATWNVLRSVSPSWRWDRYLRLLARGTGPSPLNARSVTELWPSQLAALDRGLLSGTSSLAVRMPTSSGKTRVAELAMVQALCANPDSRCLYIAPFRALANEVIDALSSIVSDLGFGVRSMLGAYDRDAGDGIREATGEVVVLTPEKADLLMRMDRAAFLERVQVVVIDEGHLVGDESRGAGFELLIARIRSAAPTARFIFLSAVVADVTLSDFAAWLGRGAEDAVTSSWRPSVQRVAALEWNGVRGTLRYAPTETDAALEEFVPSVVEQRTYTYRNQATLRLNTRVFPESGHRAQVAAETAFRLAPQGPVLIFCAVPDHAEASARALGQRIELSEAIDEPVPALFRTGQTNRAAAVALEWLGAEHWLTRLLIRGIAAHHARIPEPVRVAIEEDFRRHRLSVVAATTTLAQGVNFPVRTVIFHTTRRYDRDREQHVPLLARDYWNIAGRAGRAGEETEGTLIHLVFNATDAADYAHYLAARYDVEPTVSALFSLLRSLTLGRLTVEDVADSLDAEVLGLLAEEGQLATDDVETLLAASLVRIQADREGVALAPLKRSIEHAAARVMLQVPDAQRRQLFSATGLRLASCLAITEHVQQNRLALRPLLTGAVYSDVLPLVTTIISGLAAVAEIQPRKELSVGGDVLLPGWLDGQTPVQLALQWGMESDEVAEFIEDYFGYLLPWGISSYLTIASGLLALELLSPVTGGLSSLVRYGVPTLEAAWAMSSGVASREAAIAIAAEYGGRPPGGSPADFRRWLGTLPVDELSERLEISGSALESTSRAVLRAGPNPLLSTGGEDPTRADLVVRVRLHPRADLGQLAVGVLLPAVRDYSSGVNRNAVELRADVGVIATLGRYASQALAPALDAGDRYVAEITELEGTPPRSALVSLRRLEVAR